MNGRAEDFKIGLPEDSTARSYVTKYLEMEGDTADDSLLGKYECALNIFKGEVDERNDMRNHNEKFSSI